jgi:hypothetical protein
LRPSAFVFASALTLQIGATPAAAVEIIALHPVGGGNEPGSSTTNVLRIETDPFAVLDSFPVAVKGLSGLDFQPQTGTLFASSGRGDGGKLYTIDVALRTVTLVGNIGTGLPLVPGLAFDPDGTLYGSSLHIENVINSADFLITIPPAEPVSADFGRDPYAADGATFIEGLAVDPTDPQRTLYGVGGVCVDAPDCNESTTELFTIDKTTGLATSVGDLPVAAGQEGAVAGLAFDALGNLLASIGYSDGSIIQIHVDAAADGIVPISVLGDATPDGGSISDIAVVVPEPGWLSLRAAALVTLVLIARRRARS